MIRTIWMYFWKNVTEIHSTQSSKDGFTCGGVFLQHTSFWLKSLFLICVERQYKFTTGDFFVSSRVEKQNNKLCPLRIEVANSSFGHLFVVSAVNFAPYLTCLSSMMLMWAAGSRCKWRARLHNRVPWTADLLVLGRAFYHWAILPFSHNYQ